MLQTKRADKDGQTKRSDNFSADKKGRQTRQTKRADRQDRQKGQIWPFCLYCFIN